MNIGFINFRVYCNRDNGNTYDMQIRKLTQEDSSVIVSPCNGCEQLNGSKICLECTGKLTSMFFNNPQLDTSEPISVFSDI